MADPARGARPRNPRGHGGRLRTEIVDAAVAVVDAAETPTPLTLRGVARAAGISAPSVYAHFDSVDAIADAVLDRGFAELDEAVAAAMSGAPTPEEAVVAGCLAYVGFAWEHPRRYRFLVSASGFAPDAVRTLDRVEAALRACVAAGTSASRDPRADAFLLWSGMHGMATLEKPRPELRRLGALDRPALAAAMAKRLAGLDG